MMKLNRKAFALLACAMLTVTAAGCGNPAENNENDSALEAMASLQESDAETDTDTAGADSTEEPSDTATPTEEPSTPTDSPEESEVADPTRESEATEEPATVEPTKEPESTTEPVTEPAATAKPTAAPAATPAPTPEPTQEPAPTAEPTPAPAAPTPEPVQEPVAPAEPPAPVETPAQSASTMSQADVLAKISELQAMYPEGTAWGDNDSYDTATPVDAYITNSDACAGWVKMASDYIYGNGASATLFVASHPIHNHPSGNPQPSAEDIQATKRLKEASDMIGINFCDHLIVARDGYISFKEAGLVPEQKKIITIGCPACLSKGILRGPPIFLHDAMRGVAFFNNLHNHFSNYFFLKSHFFF